MFPASRSLLPASVGLAEWIGAHGWGGVYPQWYLGAPVRYVTGVVWPAVILGLERVFLGVSGLELSVAAMMAAIGVGVVGVGALAGWLAKDTTQKLRYTGGLVGLVAGVVFLLNPWVWVSSLGLADGGGGLGRLWLPWLIVGAGWILGRKRYGYRERILGSTLVAFAVLVSTDLLFDILVIGVVGGWVAQTSSKRRKQAWGRWVGLLVAGVGLASVWYGMDYWWQIAGVPIVGGRSLAGAVGHLWGFMAYLVPVGLVLMGVQRWGKRLSRPLVWVGLWLGVFGLMSVWRLVNDVDFWQDWSGWGVELAVGVAVLVGLVVGEWRVSRDVIAPGFVRSLLWRLKEGITLLVRPGRLLLDKLGATPGKAHFTKLMRRSTESGSVRNSHNNGRLVTTPIWFGGLILFYAVGWGVAWHYRAGWLPRERVAGSVEERVVGWVDEVYRECLDTKESGSVSLGARRDKCGRVFVSGTPTFWLNALAPEVPQVRGGRDSGAVWPGWREGMYVLRESDDPAEIETILGELGIEWVLVHADYSLEPYHDFTQSGVYESMDGLELVKNEAGDRLYRVQEPTMVAGVTEDEGVLWFRLAGLGLWLVAVGYKGWEGVVERGLRWGAVE